MALALTLIRLTCPSITARTVWMFGLNLRCEMPVIFVPTPPRYLALPRVVFLRPNMVFLPVKWQTRGIAVTSLDSKFRAGECRDTLGQMQARGPTKNPGKRVLPGVW